MKSLTFFILLGAVISTAISEDLIKPDETRTYTAQYIVKDTDICSDIVNNATVCAIDPCSKAVDAAQDMARVHITYNSAISLDKVSDKSGEEVDADDTITYTYYVANEGNVNLTDVDIIDDKVVPIYISGDNNGDGWLNLSEVWVYEDTYNVDEADLCSDIINTAIAKARDPCNRSVRPSSDTEVVKTSCNEAVCCENRSNIELTKFGRQVALSYGNGKSGNNIKIVSNQFGKGDHWEGIHSNIIRGDKSTSRCRREAR
jgi:hypothetical protein